MVVCVGGTWSEGDAASWWRPTSVWCANLRNAGLQLLDRAEPFEWSTHLAVDAGHDSTWRTAGLALKWYVQWHNVDWQAPGEPAYDITLVAHSHGGQVVAYALAAGLKVARIVTVGTPVRADTKDIWAQARLGTTQDWTHVYTEEVVRSLDSGAQPYQYLGSLPLGAGGFTREFSQATRNVKITPPTTHHGLMWSQLWNENNLWQFLS